jgi:hypothetical protein
VVCGATVQARLILAVPQHMPLAQVVPVLFRALPLKEDFAENETVYRCADALFRNQFELAAPFIEHFLLAFCTAFNQPDEQLSGATAALIPPLVQWMSANHPAPAAAAIKKLPRLAREFLQQICKAP